MRKGWRWFCGTALATCAASACTTAPSSPSTQPFTSPGFMLRLTPTATECHNVMMGLDGRPADIPLLLAITNSKLTGAIDSTSLTRLEFDLSVTDTSATGTLVGRYSASGKVLDINDGASGAAVATMSKDAAGIYVGTLSGTLRVSWPGPTVSCASATNRIELIKLVRID